VFGIRLKLLRDRRGYTQTEVAEAVGVTLQQIYRWESDKNDPSGDMIVKLAKFLEVSTDYLLGVSDEPLPNLSEDDLTPMERKFLTAVRDGRIVDALQAFTALSEGQK
jgi:transcriptional regulator with XRE-family HTH domain